MKASELIELIEHQIKYHGDLEITCEVGDSWYEVRDVKYEDDEIFVECKDLNYYE